MSLHNRSVRRDVRELGALLGDVLEVQSSGTAFDAVESLRTGAIDVRRGDATDREALKREIRELSSDLEMVVARAFTSYFELINLAEERERVREIRLASQSGELGDSLEEAAETLADADPETAEQVLADVLVEPTFTAHPTEARRKTIKAKLREVGEHLERLDECTATDKEDQQIWQDLEAAVTSLWQTLQVRRRRPSPEDEARNVLWYLENTLFEVIGEVYDEFADALEDATGEEMAVPRLFAFRSWAGSDRDGNPFVTPDVTENTLERQRTAAIEHHRDACKRLSGVLSHDGSRITPGQAFDESFAADRERHPGIAAIAEDRYPGEPYRQKLRLMRERLDRVGDVRPGGYDDSSELLADLEVIRDSLLENGSEPIVDAEVDPVLRQVETFGFTLASLDLRDHRENHTEAVDALLDRVGIPYRSESEEERQRILTEAILQPEPVVDLSDHDGLSETAARVSERFDRLAGWQAEYGPEAIDAYCISMTDEPSHVLEVVFLADQADVVSLPDYSGLDIVPLLETESALSGARRIMGTLFENEAYAGVLSARGGVQEVMLGYSDSNKENGFLAANWSLSRNQRRLGRIAEDYDVTLRLFHGRGGSISRGGGPMNEALLALPSETVTGPVKFTEQGEAIHEKYGNPRIAERELEQMLNAQVRARLRSIETADETVPDEWEAAMDTMADAAREAYRGLLESEGFVPYFEQATPIRVIENLNLGSRPASRTGERNVEDLRAIPWVFSWTQSRCILPGWYSLGSGVDAYLADGGDIDLLQEMYEDWPFFRTILDNAALSLARTDLDIAAEYAALADRELRDRFFTRIEEEYDRSAERVRQITERETLYSREWFGESLRRRNPYVDPLNLLQTHLLSQTHLTEEEERTLRLTVKGIAAGMKNTG